LDGINTIATKTSLYLTLLQYYRAKGENVFDAVPDTYIINLEHAHGRKDHQLDEFLKVAADHIWILKPGENTNRGHGIQIFNDIRKIIHSINDEYMG